MTYVAFPFDLGFISLHLMHPQLAIALFIVQFVGQTLLGVDVVQIPLKGFATEPFTQSHPLAHVTVVSLSSVRVYLEILFL